MVIKLHLLLLIMLFISSVALVNSSQSYWSALDGQSLINLEGSDALIVPKMSQSKAGDQTYLFDRLPVYSLNQSINGIFLSPNGRGSNKDTKSKIIACVSLFNISEYLAGFPENSYFSRIDCNETTVEWNKSNAANFTISKKPAGMYTLHIFDENNSTLLSKQPFLITDGEIVLIMDQIVESSEPFIRIKMNSTVFKNQSKVFATFMIPRKDYDNISLSIAENRTTGSPDLNLSLGSKYFQMYGSPHVSSDLLMNLLPLLPQGSAVGFQESTQPGVDLILMTDKPWVKGQYVLVCGIYSSENGLIGINQTNVEVI